MKIKTPALFALILSFILSITVFLVLKFFFNFDGVKIPIQTQLLVTLFVFLPSFIFSFLVANNSFKKLENIHNTLLKHRKQPEITNDGGIIENIQRQLNLWALERDSEIEQMKKLELYRKEFLGNVSHELKTPVFNIQGYVLTLLDGGIDDPAINKDYLARTEKSVDRMITIIDDLEAISQLETGELELEYERFDIVALTHDIFEAQELKATGKGIILSLEEKEPKPIFVWADKFRIRQVMTNLIVNSINYGKEYGETVVRFYEYENKLMVEVEDNGIGVAKEHLPRLFERFYRADKSRSREQGGTGLGLSIVKHIIEAHNQTIKASSKEGVGTNFSFSLKKA